MEEIKWERLAPPAIIIKVLLAIRSYALLIIFFAYRTYQRFDEISIFNSFDLFLDFLLNILPGVLVVLSGIMEYKRYRYRLDADQFHVNRGWIRRERKSIPVDKIQSVQIEQNWLYRLLNVYLVKIDTIGEQDLEVELGGVREDEAEQLKQQIQSFKKSPEKKYEIVDDLTIEDESAIGMEYSLTNKEIARYAFTENLLWFLLPLSLSIILLYRFYYSTDAEQLTWQLLIDLVFGSMDPTTGSAGSETFTFSYIILYGLLLATFSSGMFFFNKIFGLFNYRMNIQNQEIRISRGLVNRFETIIPKRKIQFTTWYTNLVRRKLGIYTLSYKYAGGRKTLGSDAVVPFFDTDILPELNKPYSDIGLLDDVQPLKIDPVYVFRNYIFAKLPIALAIIFVCYWIHNWLFYASFFVLLYFWIHNYYYVRNFELYLHREYFFLRKGVWGRHHFLVRWEKIQKTDLRQSPFQRRNGFAHLYLNTASSNLVIPYLRLSPSHDIMDYALYKTESSPRFLF